MLMTGVYQIRHVASGRLYIGGAFRSFSLRLTQHRSDLNHNRHGNVHLQRAWNKYGEDAFEFEILERCLPEDVEACEQKWLDWLWEKGRKARYNLCSTSESVFGLRLTAEQRARRSRVLKGKVHTAESYARAVATRRARNGYQFSEKTRRRWSRIRKGRKHTDATRAKMSANRKGKKRSLEFCAKMKLIALAREERMRGTRQQTSEAKRMIGEASKRTWEKRKANPEQMDEWSSKMSAALVGKPLSESHRLSLCKPKGMGRTKKVVKVSHHDSKQKVDLMKSGGYLPALRATGNQIMKSRASPGELILGALFPSRGVGWP